MGHCRFEQLQDLHDVFEEIRTWPGIQEPKPGIFYVKRTAFLHFHDDATGRRWADIRDGASWGAQLEILPTASAAERKRFAVAVRRCYEATALQLRVPGLFAQ